MFRLGGAFILVYDDDRPLVVRPRSSIAERPDTAVLIGHAPDGLPLALRVERRASVAPAVCGALGLSRERLPADIVAALTRLEEVVLSHARAVGVTSHQGRPLYVTALPLGALLGETLLVRTLGAQSPLVLPDDLTSESPERIANTSAVARIADCAPVMTRLGVRLHLGVHLDERPPLVVAGVSEGPPPRPLVVEDLRRLASTQVHWRSESGEAHTQPLAEVRYERLARDASSLAWSVSRQDLANTVIELGRTLAELHGRGLVHADVKPANTLVTATRVIAHDGLDVPAGEVSPAATPGWSAPEQVLARPVSPATDVFALGLLAARIADAAIYGEERSFVIPTGGAGRRRMRVLAAPEVFLDPTHLGVEPDTRAAWEHLLTRAVAFEPEARFADGAEFADALAELLARHPLPGRLGLAGGPGRLTRNVELLGRVQPAWVLHDRR